MITAKISNIKKRRSNLFIFQKTEKVMNTHIICNYSDHLFSVSYCYIFIVLYLILFFPGYFLKFWCIYDLISIYYLLVENWPCNLWIEIFDKLKICCWVWPNFCSGNFGKLFVTFLAKIKTTVLQENHPCTSQSECLLFLVIQGVNKGPTLVFSQIFW